MQELKPGVSAVAEGNSAAADAARLIAVGEFARKAAEDGEAISLPIV